MSEVSVDHPQARANLQAAWEKVGGKLAPPAVLEQIKQILLARDVAFKYMLVTGLLGKLTNPAVHPRALQAQGDLAGAYHARSLCHKVIVRFEKDTKLNLFGRSNEPLVGKPARHPVHDKANKQLKNKRLAAVLHDVLEIARCATPAEVEAMLVAADLVANLGHVLDFVQEFLKEGDSCARLVAVTGAFLSLLSESYTVKVYHSTASDQFAGTAGDIEVYAGKSLYSAYECKHRPLNLDDVRHGIDKSKTKGVPEYCFITAAGLAKGQEAAIRAEIKEEGDLLDVSLLDIQKAAKYWAVALNPARRNAVRGQGGFPAARLHARHDAANAAAEVWNLLENRPCPSASCRASFAGS